MRLRGSNLLVLAAVSGIFAAGTAHATVYEVSTSNKFFCCTVPFSQLPPPPPPPPTRHTVVATASVTGTGTQALKFGMGHAVNFYSMWTIPDLPPISLKTNIGTKSYSNASGTLQKSGGNLASFSFCPKAKGPGPGACTDPSQATPAYFNGRIKVTPGPNKFGGTLQILAGPGGIGGSKFFVYRLVGMASGVPVLPAQLLHGRIPFSGVGAATPGYVATTPVTNMTGFPPDFDSMTQMQVFWAHGAGRFTTGMLTVHISMNNNPPNRSVMLTGYDNRTPAGLGHLQVVSGLLLNVSGPMPGSNPLGWRMRIHVIPEPAAGAGVAAGALALLCIGWMGPRRRR